MLKSLVNVILDQNVPLESRFAACYMLSTLNGFLGRHQFFFTTSLSAFPQLPSLECDSWLCSVVYSRAVGKCNSEWVCAWLCACVKALYYISPAPSIITHCLLQLGTLSWAQQTSDLSSHQVMYTHTHGTRLHLYTHLQHKPLHTCTQWSEKKVNATYPVV